MSESGDDCVQQHCRILFDQRLGVEFDRVRLQDLTCWAIAHIEPDEQQMLYLHDNLRVFLSASDQKILKTAKPDSKAVEELLTDVCGVLKNVEKDLKLRLERLSMDRKKNPEEPVYLEFELLMRPHMRMVARVEHAVKFKKFRNKKTRARKTDEERVGSEKRVKRQGSTAKKVEEELIRIKIAERAVENRAAIADEMEAKFRDFIDGKSSLELGSWKIGAHQQDDETLKSILSKCRPVTE